MKVGGRRGWAGVSEDGRGGKGRGQRKELAWIQSNAVLTIRGTPLLQASSKGLKYLSASTRPSGRGKASDLELL